MTKQELLDLLEPFPNDALILVDGHSDGSGFNELEDVSEIVVKAFEKRHWSGKFHEPYDERLGFEFDTHLPSITAIHLS